MFSRLHYLRSFLTVLGVCAAFVAMGLLAPVEAGFSSCSGDPILVLSDGSVLSVSVRIGTDASQVTTIDYAVHGPRGTKLVAVLNTPMVGFEGKEHFAFTDDAQPNQFLTDTMVQTRSNNVKVTATTTLGIRSKSVAGTNGQHLKITLYR